MQSTLFYLLQVTICSAVLFAYYQIALRNKRFHQYNRYYLLGVLLLSWLIPLVKIPVVKPTNAIAVGSQGTQRVWEVIADNNSSFEQYVYDSSSAAQVKHMDVMQAASIVYFLIAAVLLLMLVIHIARLVYLRRQYRNQQVVNGVVVIHTAHPKAPFSFFRWIFWSDQLDMQSPVGHRILQHELVHVQQQHSIDKIVGYLVTVAGWFNPVFWLCRKELAMIHEFIADEKAADDDATALAEMLLTVHFPGSFPLAHSFFQSPIKRRLRMISFNPKRSYLRRLMVLPLIVGVVMLVAFRKDVQSFVQTKKLPKVQLQVQDTVHSPNGEYTVADVKLEKIQDDPAALVVNNVKLENIGIGNDLKKQYIVMIDAGHGGYDGGAVSGDGLKESDFAFQLMQEIKRQNTSSNISFVFSRTSDEYVDPKTRVARMNEKKADVVISLHANASEDAQRKGIEIFVPTSDTLLHYRASFQLATAMALLLSNGTEGSHVSIHSRQTGIWVINAAKRPAILIEAGYLTNPSEAAKLKSKEYQEKLVKAILKGLQVYFENAEGC